MSAKSDINRHDRLTLENVRFIRASSGSKGMSAAKWNLVVGKRLKDLRSGDPITESVV